jgi:hypothetical protein
MKCNLISFRLGLITTLPDFVNIGSYSMFVPPLLSTLREGYLKIYFSLCQSSVVSFGSIKNVFHLCSMKFLNIHQQRLQRPRYGLRRRLCM